MNFDITEVIDLQSMQVQALLGFAISWAIRRAVKSDLPILKAVKFTWARWLSVLASALVALGIHMTWAGDWSMVAGGTINLSLMIPSLSDLVNATYQFVSNEINYRVFHKERPVTA